MAGNLSTCWTVVLLILSYLGASTWQLASAATGCGGLPQGSDHADQEPAFVLEKVATQLQRRLLKIEAANSSNCYYLGINGTLFFGENQNAAIQQLDAQLAELAVTDAEKETIRIYQSTTYFGDLPQGNKQSQNAQLVAKALERASLKKLKGDLQMEPDSRNWTKKLKLLKSKNLIEEELAGDENVLVYSVQTPFSKMLTSGADCYVEVNRAIVESEGFLDAATRKSLTECLTRIKRRGKNTIQLRVYAVEAAKDWPDRLKSELQPFVTELGFEKFGFTYSPDQVRLAESAALIGGLAPDFELPDFATGKQVKMSEASAGKFVILNFWGNT